MNANELIEDVMSAASTASVINRFPANVVEAHTLRENLPKLDDMPCICVGIESFVYGEHITETADDGSIVITNKRQYTACVSVGIYFEKNSKPKDMYNLFNILCAYLLSLDEDKSIISLEHGGVEYDRTYDSLILRGKIIESTVV